MSNQWMSSKGDLGQVIVECAPGDSVRICHSPYFKGVADADLVNGFRLSYPDMGSLSASTDGGDNDGSDGWNCVEYSHENYGTQVVEFIENMSRRRSYIQVEGNIPIHDHASIPQGGPAYATYYSEIEEDGAGE